MQTVLWRAFETAANLCMPASAFPSSSAFLADDQENDSRQSSTQHRLIKRVIGTRHPVEGELLLNYPAVELAHLAAQCLRVGESANGIHQLIDRTKLAQVAALFVLEH